MKLKKFEKYIVDLEGGDDISLEYAKLIISTFIDNSNKESLESVYADIIKGDDLDETQEAMIQESITFLLKNWYIASKSIRKVIEIDANKYNV